MTPRILTLSRECESLQRRIAQRQARHEGIGDLSARLIALRVRQLKAELKEERRKAS